MKDKVINDLLKRISDLEFEVEKKDRIINELEKALKSHKDLKTLAHYGEYYVEIEEVYNYLQKLKDSDKE